MIRLIHTKSASSCVDANAGSGAQGDTPEDSFARVIGQKRAVGFMREIHEGVQLGAHTHPILFQGRSGNGKTTLAKAFADALDADFIRIDCGPELKSEDLIARLTEINSFSVVFCDEMHSMRKRVQEVLYTAVDVNQVPKLNRRRVDRCAPPTAIEPFILIGATNEPGRLLPALRNRMVNVVLEEYSPADLRKIVDQKSQRMLLGLSDAGSELVVNACGGSPRQIMKILQAVDCTSASWRYGQQHAEDVADVDALNADTAPDDGDEADGAVQNLVGQSLEELFGEEFPDLVGGSLLSLTGPDGGDRDRSRPDRSAHDRSAQSRSDQTRVGSSRRDIDPAGLEDVGSSGSGLASINAYSDGIQDTIPDQFIEKALAHMGLDSAGLDATARTLLGTIAEHKRSTAETLAAVLGVDMAYTREQLAELRARHLVNAAPGRGWCLTSKGEAYAASLAASP